MALETYQDLMAIEPNEAQDASFATVAEIFDDGVTLIFDGMEEATTKHYQTNAFVVFKAGDRVRVIKDSGTYIVEYPVGAPRKTFVADEAAYTANAENASYATKAGTASYASNAGSVSAANYAYFLYSGGNPSNPTIALRYYNGYFWASYDGGTWTRLN